MCATRGWEKVSESDVQKFQRRTEAIANTPTNTSTSKYRNRICYVEGLRFQSKHEAECWMTLQMLEREGKIFELRRQVPFDLCCPTHFHGVNVTVCHYIADFVWFDADRKQHIGDAKSEGTRTKEYLLKRKWLALQTEQEIEEL